MPAKRKKPLTLFAPFRIKVVVAKPKEYTSRRIIQKFWWLPKKINGEIRWLECSGYLEERINGQWTIIDWA